MTELRLAFSPDFLQSSRAPEPNVPASTLQAIACKNFSIVEHEWSKVRPQLGLINYTAQDDEERIRGGEEGYAFKVRLLEGPEDATSKFSVITFPV